VHAQTPLDWLAINPERTVAECTSFISLMVNQSRSEGVVVGLSGGVDSSVVAALCVRALGKQRVLGVLIPVDFTPKEDVSDAEKIASQLGIETRTLDMTDILQELDYRLDEPKDHRGRKMALANLLARLRMVVLYYYANLSDRLVAGTSDKSEFLIGYFTKYGDGAADFYPIRHLYKTQVLRIGDWLGLPRSVLEKPSSPQLYPGHRISDELPVEYKQLDPALYAMYELNLSIEVVSRETGIPIEALSEIQRMHSSTEHKRLPPPMISPSA